MNNDELYHHGIKGMKWGVRRYQRPDGSYTPEGAKRYGHRTASANAEVGKRQEEYRKSNARNPYSLETSRKLDELNNAKFVKNKAKALDTIDEKGLNKSAKKYEKDYLDKGYSPEDAKVAAYNKDRTKKVLMVAGGVAVTGIAAYAGYNYWKQNADHMIKSDLYRFTPNGGKGLHDAFYATPHKRDAKKYVGLYGGGQMGGALGQIKGYQKTISVGQEGLRVAGDKSARKVLSGLMNDDTFKKDFEEVANDWLNAVGPMGAFTKQGKTMRKALDDIAKGKNDSKAVYEAFNVALAGQSERKNKFLNALREAGYDAVVDVNDQRKSGYDAVVDVNDQRKSGYDAKMPVIVFNKDKVQVAKVREIGQQEMAKALKDEQINMLGKATAKSVVGYGGATAAAVAGVRALNTRSKQKQVREYKKKHPNTKMTDLEILDSITKAEYKG